MPEWLVTALVTLLGGVLASGGTAIFMRKKYNADVFEVALKPLREAIEFLDTRLERAMADYRLMVEERDMWKQACEEAKKECQGLARKLVDMIERNADMGIERDDARDQVRKLRALYEPNYEPQKAPSGAMRQP